MRLYKKYLTIGYLILFFSITQIQAQSDFYAPEAIQDIKIYFEQDNWDQILDDLYVAGEKERLLASVEINGTPIDSVGIRYKGFSSVSVDRAKNPFNIKLDYINDQGYEGFKKIKLSNVIQDPSFVREILSYDIARQYMPASECNFAKVYINDVFWGVYTNVEAVNNDFLAKHYGNNENAFFKCNPEILDFDGDNSNLTYLGADSSAYFPYYDMRSDNGWNELSQMIEVLNNDPNNIETILNIDRTLWMHAFNYVLVNFDSYVGYAQNFYLYQDDNGQFNPIIWDLNQSFASFRLADASEYFDGFSIASAKTMDPLLHYESVSVYPRPLMRNLFENDTYRRMYLAHIRTIVEENFVNQSYYDKAQVFQSLIDEAVAADTNKFYTYEDFQHNINTTVTDLVEYPGITDLMDARTDYLMSYEGITNAPSISNIESPIELNSQPFTITAAIDNTENSFLAYRFNGNNIFQKVAMLDDGIVDNGIANDGIYGATIQAESNSVQYYIYAENEESGRFSPERAAYEFYSITTPLNVGDIVINEFMADNETTITDENEQFEDWIELYNTTDNDVSTAGLYLSDKLDNVTKWALPDVTIPADGYLLIWADEDGSEGELHANFKLSNGGEAIVLAYAENAILDQYEFGEQTTDISTGRLPNGTGNFVEMSPTPNATNMLTNTVEIQTTGINLYPNPATNTVRVELDEPANQIEIKTINGVQIQRQNIDQQQNIDVHTHSLSAGLYLVYAYSENGIRVQKLIIQK